MNDVTPTFPTGGGMAIKSKNLAARIHGTSLAPDTKPAKPFNGSASGSKAYVTSNLSQEKGHQHSSGHLPFHMLPFHVHRFCAFPSLFLFSLFSIDLLKHSTGTLLVSQIHLIGKQLVLSEVVTHGITGQSESEATQLALCNL